MYISATIIEKTERKYLHVLKMAVKALIFFPDFRIQKSMSLTVSLHAY